MKILKIFSYATVVLSIASFIPVHAGLLDYEVYEKEAEDICELINQYEDSDALKKYILDKKNALIKASNKDFDANNQEMCNIIRKLHHCEIYNTKIIPLNDDNTVSYFPDVKDKIDFLFAQNVTIFCFNAFPEKDKLEMSQNDFIKALCKFFKVLSLSSADLHKTWMFDSLIKHLLDEATTFADIILKKLEQETE